jgi:putative lipoprotein
VSRALLLALLLSSGTTLAQQADDWLGPDKALHFAASAGIAGAGTLGAALISDAPAVKLAVGCTLAILAGAGKELLDLAGLGNPSWRDFAWDVVGTFTGALTALLIDHLLLAPLGRLPVW